MSDTPLPEQKDQRFDYVRKRRRRRIVIYKEKPSNGEKALLRWILGVVSSVFVGGIFGYWQQTITLAEVRTQVSNLKERFDHLEKLVVEPLMRAKPPSPVN